MLPNGLIHFGENYLGPTTEEGVLNEYKQKRDVDSFIFLAEFWRKRIMGLSSLGFEKLCGIEEDIWLFIIGSE